MSKRKPIRQCYIENDIGRLFGIDRTTPVPFVFSNRVPRDTVYFYALGLDDNDVAQAWFRENKRIVISYGDLALKLMDFRKGVL